MISSSFFWRETCIFANCTATLHWGTPPSPGSLLFGWFQDPGGRDFNETLGTKFNKDLLPGVSLESRLTKEIKIEILGSPDSPVFPATFASDGDSCLLPWTLVWHLWGLLRKKIEILAVVIILNPISSVCSHGSWDRTTQKKIPPRGGGDLNNQHDRANWYHNEMEILYKYLRLPEGFGPNHKSSVCSAVQWDQNYIWNPDARNLLIQSSSESGCFSQKSPILQGNFRENPAYLTRSLKMYFVSEPCIGRDPSPRMYFIGARNLLHWWALKRSWSEPENVLYWSPKMYFIGES